MWEDALSLCIYSYSSSSVYPTLLTSVDNFCQKLALIWWLRSDDFFLSLLFSFTFTRWLCTIGRAFPFPCVLTAWKHGFLFYAMSCLLTVISYFDAHISNLAKRHFMLAPVFSWYCTFEYFVLSSKDVPGSCTFAISSQESAISPRKADMYAHILYIYNAHFSMYPCKSYTSSSTSASHNS